MMDEGVIVAILPRPMMRVGLGRTSMMGRPRMVLRVALGLFGILA
jgi:hypothetical protein